MSLRKYETEPGKGPHGMNWYEEYVELRGDHERLYKEYEEVRLELKELKKERT